MAAICDAVIHLCRIRATRLDQLGSPLGGPNNVYVSANPMMLISKAIIEAGQDKPLVGGCDCIIAQYRGFDKLKRFDLELDLGTVEPGLLEMLTGGTPVLDAGGFPIGLEYPTDITCGAPIQPNVAFEAWADLWEDDHQASTYPYVRFVWPSTHWQTADFTLQNDFMQPKLTAFTRNNPNWGLGIYGDQPQAFNRPAFFFDSALPAASCGWTTHNVT